MFGFGKKVANSDALVSTLIQLTCAHWNELHTLPTAETLISDVPIMLNNYGAKIKLEHTTTLATAAMFVAGNVNGLGDDCKIGVPASVSDQDIKDFTMKLERLGVWFR